MSPTEETKLIDACRAAAQAAADLRAANHTIACAIPDLRMALSVIEQFSDTPEATQTRRKLDGFLKAINRADFSSITIPAARIAEQAYENRHP